MKTRIDYPTIDLFIKAIHKDFTVLPFTKREEYLIWKGLWKQAYKELSALIHHTKECRSITHPEHDLNADSMAAYYRKLATDFMAHRMLGKNKGLKMAHDSKLITELKSA
jgi:hypothetical protein